MKQGNAIEQFDISVRDQTLTVFKRSDGVYSIFEGFRKLGDLTPEHTDNGLIWTTADLIAKEYARQIGEKIEKHDT